MIIDAHAHVFPDAVAEKAVSKLGRYVGGALPGNGTLAGLRDSMRAAGVSMTAHLPVSTAPEHVRSVNLFAAALAEAPDIISFGSLFPGAAGWREELRMLREAGARGVKLHPDYQGFKVDERRLFPIYEALAEAGMFLFFHAGRNINLPDPPGCTPRRLAKVVSQFKSLKIIAAHLGGWRMWDEVERELAGMDLFLDTSFCSGYAPEQQILRIIRSHGPSRILFGTDWPWSEQKSALDAFLALPLDRRERELILYKNAQCLFGRKPAEPNPLNNQHWDMTGTS